MCVLCWLEEFTPRPSCLSSRRDPGVSDWSAGGSHSVQTTEKSLPLQEGKCTGWWVWHCSPITLSVWNRFCELPLHLFSGEDEEADSSEALRKFKKSKRKKTVVSLIVAKGGFLKPALGSCAAFLKKSLCLQSLPQIDLNNYSVLPVDEGDEDREAGIGDEEDEGSDLDIGDDPTDAGELLKTSL